MLQRLDSNGCLLDQCFCCHPESQGPVWFPFRRSLEERSAKVTNDHVWKEIWLVTFLFAGMRGVCEFTQKLGLDSNYCLSFRIATILKSFHS